jgi:chloramphenicol O-acetyltransferase
MKKLDEELEIQKQEIFTGLNHLRDDFEELLNNLQKDIEKYGLDTYENTRNNKSE